MVVNTHFHVDHVLNNCLFPESEIYGSQQSHEWCCEAYTDLLDEQNWEKLSLKYYPESGDYEGLQLSWGRCGGCFALVGPQTPGRSLPLPLG